MENGKKKKKNNALFIIVILICAAVMGISLYKLITINGNYDQARDEYEALRQYVTVNEEAGDDGAGNEEVGNGAGSGTGGNAYDDENGEDASNGGRNATSGRNGEETGTEEEASPGGRNAASGTGGTEKDSDDNAVATAGKERRKLRAPVIVDHKALLAGNPDYRGWIYIEALPNISYPIMQGPDNDYYLHRTYEKAELFAGSIFLDYQCSPDFSDMNTLIYGHNMKDDSMFGILQSIRDDALYKKSPYFWILTAEGNYRYRMFSMFSTDITSEAYILHKTPNKQFVDWIGKVKGFSDVDMGDMEYDEKSHIVTLSTCISGQGPDRFLILGIRVDEEKINAG
ncbi:MAG: class B sortase [Lachnospiraceae bacterium]|nr:class B sortase [Lachnospiraceae bacterium]